MDKDDMENQPVAGPHGLILRPVQPGERGHGPVMHLNNYGRGL